MKKKLEWSKLLTTIISIICIAISVYCIWKYYYLCELAITAQSMSMPDSTLPVASITSLLASVLSYLTYQGVLKSSLNKHNLIKDADGIIRSITNGDIANTISQAQDAIEQAEQDNVEYEDPIEIK